MNPAKYAMDGFSPDASGILDIAVSFDGSWQTRGHHSNIGIGFVIDASTGAVLDYEVQSKLCRICSHMQTK